MYIFLWAHCSWYCRFCRNVDSIASIEIIFIILFGQMYFYLCYINARHLSIEWWCTTCSSHERSFKKPKELPIWDFSPRNIMIQFYDLACSRGRVNHFWPAVAWNILAISGRWQCFSFPQAEKNLEFREALRERSSLMDKAIWNTFTLVHHWLFHSLERICKNLWSLHRSSGLCYSKIQILSYALVTSNVLKR